MTPDATATTEDSSPEVMASVDSGPDGCELVIADLTSDEAWISVAFGDAPSLSEWR
jgi:hypothetical protein